MRTTLEGFRGPLDPLDVLDPQGGLSQRLSHPLQLDDQDADGSEQDEDDKCESYDQRIARLLKQDNVNLNR